MKPYVIRQGDHLQKLALRMGFDPDATWNHPENRALREKRDPNLLHPGDVIQVPDAASQGLTLRQGTTNSYTARVPRVQVRVVFSGPKGPMADEPYAIRGFAAPEG